MKRQDFRIGNEGRRGVALIIVLGFLSIMVMMALAFLTQARTERLVANSTLDAQRGRQLVRTGLSAAMSDYSAELFPDSGDRYLLPPPSMVVYPSIRPNVLPSMGTLKDDGIQLMAGEAGDWIPRRYLTAAVSNLVEDAEWIMVRENPSALSPILGRYAYVCFDMSGGIDANLIALSDGVASQGNPTNRSSVRDVGMAELAETVDAGEFKRLRLGWHGFDTLSEVIKLADGHYVDGQEPDYTSGGTLQNFGKYPSGSTYPSGQRWRGNRVERSPALDPDLVTDLAPYSLAAYRGRYDVVAGWKPDDVKSCGQIKTAAEWDAALTDVQSQLVDPAEAITAIQDYTNANVHPFGVDYPSVKNVPMLNEFRTQYRFRFIAPSQIQLDVRLGFEVWYPFPSQDNPDGTPFWIDPLNIRLGSAPAAATDNAWLRPILIDTNGNPVTATLQELSAAATRLDFSSDFNGGSPKAVSGDLEYSYQFVPTDPAFVPSANVKLQVFLDLRSSAAMPNAGADVKMQDGGTVRVVDRMQLQEASRQMVPGPEWQSFFMESVDPRLNHDNNNWKDVEQAGTWDALNSVTAAEEEYTKEGQYMFCRNGPMRSPAELGFIPTGRPWETIDLCNDDGANMLAQLVASDEIIAALTNASPDVNHTFYTNGTINPNTSSTNVLMAAFAGLTKLEVPNPQSGISSETISSDEARILAESMISGKTNIIRATGGAFMSGADWVRVPAMVDGGDLALTGLNENQRESLIRNTWGLFSPNNSMFTVLVIGQAIKEAPGQHGVWNEAEDMVTGERRAVALVWRDPTPSGNTGHHEMFVRMYKLLDE